MLTENEIKELHDEYYALSDKIREMESRQMEIDGTINNAVKEKVASRFIPLKFGDKIKVKVKYWYKPDEITEHEGFFGSWVLDGHQYTVDGGAGRVRVRLYQIKKDGTRSERYNEYYANDIVDIVKMED